MTKKFNHYIRLLLHETALQLLEPQLLTLESVIVMKFSHSLTQVLRPFVENAAVKVPGQLLTTLMRSGLVSRRLGIFSVNSRFEECKLSWIEHIGLSLIHI